MVVALQIVNGKLGQHSGLAGLGGAGLHLFGGKMRKGQRQVKQAAAAACFCLQHFAEFLQRDLVIGKDVALALAPAVSGGNRTGGQVAHIDKVERALHTNGHFTVQNLDQRAGRLPDGGVVGAKNTAGMHHAGIQPVRGGVQHLLGRHGLAAAVPADHAVIIVGNKAVYLMDALALRQLGDGAGAGNIDELFALRVIFGSIQHIFGAAHIDGDELFTVIRVDGHHTRAVDADSLDARLHGKEFLTVLGTAEVTFKDFDGLWHKFYSGVALQHKSAHGITALQKLCADICAHKSGSTGDKIDRFHSCILRFPVGCFCFDAPKDTPPK